MSLYGQATVIIFKGTFNENDFSFELIIYTKAIYDKLLNMLHNHVCLVSSEEYFDTLL